MDLILRIESVALFVATLVGFHFYSGNWTLFITFFLLPDISLLVFLFGARAGCIAYNTAHSTTLPVIVFVVAMMSVNKDILMASALIWFAHVHFDRALGFGLKKGKSFYDTHLGRIGRAN